MALSKEKCQVRHLGQNNSPSLAEAGKGLAEQESCREGPGGCRAPQVEEDE